MVSPSTRRFNLSDGRFYEQCSLISRWILSRLAGRFVYGPLDMEELLAKKDEIVANDLLKMKLTV